MKICVPKETKERENRVALTPTVVKQLVQAGYEVFIEQSAGLKSYFDDANYAEAGASIVADTRKIYSDADVVLKVNAPNAEEVSWMKKEAILISFMFAATNKDIVDACVNAGISSFSMDAVPRISRAQKMDVLSSMANIAGYRAVIEGSYHFGRFLNGQITAAGKVEPAKVLVIGAGVAGLAAIGAANSLGAIVRAFDTRKEVAEQIESMGAQFLTVEINEDGATSSGYSKEMSKEFIEAEMKLFLEQAKEVDIVITTAQIPGKSAPKLWMDYHVAAMKPGSVIVDLAASTGGNCALTKNGEVYATDNGVTMVGKLSQLPSQASQLYGNNLCHLLDDMGKAEKWKIDMEDAVVSRAMVTYNGKINWPPAPLPVSPTAGGAKKVIAPTAEEVKASDAEKSKKAATSMLITLAIVGAMLLLVGKYAPKEFIQHFTVFVLSIFVGWQLITNVAHALHTPLMAVTNAISGIIVVGGLLQTTNNIKDPVTIIAVIAILIASINIVGGFLVTHRMLKMFKK